MKAKSILLENNHSFAIVEIHPKIFSLIFTETKIVDKEIGVKVDIFHVKEKSLKKIADIIEEAIK